MRIREPLPPSRTEGGRGLHRDLDDIVLMAMQPEPDKRYPSAAAFEADIRRYLDSRPVQARKGSLHYRAAKLLSRNKVRRRIVAIGGRAGRRRSGHVAGSQPLARVGAAADHSGHQSCRARRASRTSRRTGRRLCTFGAGRTAKTRTCTSSRWRTARCAGSPRTRRRI